MKMSEQKESKQIDKTKSLQDEIVKKYWGVDLEKDREFTKIMKPFTRISAAITLAGMILVGYAGKSSIKEYRSICQKVLAPVVSEVRGQQIKPSELEIRIADLDEDGKSETIIKVQGQEYLMRTDSQGKTQLLKYKVETTKPIYESEQRKIVTEVPDEQVKIGKLEVRLEDLDGDGKKEPITRAQGQDYLMRVDKEGMIQLLKYKVEKTPAVYVPGKTRIITEQDAGYQIQK
jgi:hemin uptake protein HemP